MQTEFAILAKGTGLTTDELSKQLGFSTRTIHRWEKGEILPKPAVIQLLMDMSAKKQKHNLQTSFSFIDLFAGIGGLRKPFQEIGGECLFTSEWDSYAQQTYLANFGCKEPIWGDITKIDAADIPKHDVLLAGFPCQPFSIAGVSKSNSLNRPHGFRNETQGTLFFDVARIIEHHRPKVFLLENVKNLVNHNKGNTFKVIYKTLKEELGYHVACRVIDAKGWVPQHRERIFIAGFRDSTCFDFKTLCVPDPLDGPKIGSILHREDGLEDELDKNRKYLDELGRVLPKYTLSDKLWLYLQEYAAKHKAKGNGFGCSVVEKDDVARTLSARYYKDGSEILVHQGANKNPRRLTPRECARLMGYDNPGESSFIIPVSDTQAYKQFGNSVVVPAVRAIAIHMLPWITTKKDKPLIKELCMESHG